MASNADKELAENLDKIRADISALSETVRTLVSDTAGIQTTLKKKVGETTRQAASVGEKLLHDATGIGNEALHSAAKQASEAIDNIEVKISRNPFTSVLIALGVGFALGVINRR